MKIISLCKRLSISSIALFLFCTDINHNPVSARQELDVLPVYVGQGSTTIIKNACFTAVYDMGGEIKYIDSVIHELTTSNYPDKQKYIDLMMISHGHYDHISYLERLFKEGFKINKLITNTRTFHKLLLIPGFNQSVKYMQGFNASLDEHTQVIKAQEFTDCRIDLNIEIFWGSTSKSQRLGKKYNRKKGNNDSLVVGIFGDSLKRSLMFLGDANSTAQKKLLRYKYMALDRYNQSILFVGHHGYSNGINHDFLSYLSPSSAVISRSSSKLMLEKDLMILNSFLKPINNTSTSRRYDVLCSPLPRALRYKDHLKASYACPPLKVNSNIFLLSPRFKLNLAD